MVASRIHDYLRGGLPAQSLRDGGRSADPPSPSLDSVDEQQLTLLTRYQMHLTRADLLAEDEAWRSALRELRAAFVIETGVIPEQHLSTERLTELHQRAKRLATLDHSTRAVECINPNCARPIECTPQDRPRAGRCFNCWRYWRDHDHAERPAELCALDIERQSA